MTMNLNGKSTATTLSASQATVPDAPGCHGGQQLRGICDADLAPAAVGARVKAFRDVARKARGKAERHDREVSIALTRYYLGRAFNTRMSGVHRAAGFATLAQAYRAIESDTEDTAGVLARALEGTPQTSRSLTTGQRAALRAADPAVRVRAAVAHADGVVAALRAWRPDLMDDLLAPRRAVKSDRPGGVPAAPTACPVTLATDERGHDG